MRKRLSLPSPAMAVAFLALLAALAGTAVALPGRNSVGIDDMRSNSVGKAELRTGSTGKAEILSRAVGAAEVINNSLGGDDINEGRLGTVPRANVANAATFAGLANSANSANSAGAVDGQSIAAINFRDTSAAADTPILNFNGLRIEITCPGSDESIQLDTTQSDGEVSSISTDASNDDVSNAFDDDFDPGDDVDATEGGPGSDRIYNVVYTAANGEVVTANFVTEDDVGTNDCVANGYATG